MRESTNTVMWVLISLISASFIFGVMGIIVEYTKLGTNKLTFEEGQ